MSATSKVGIATDPATAEVKYGIEAPNYFNQSHGILSWLLTLDHKRIGIMYLCGILTAFAVGGLFAILVRTELFYAGADFIKDPNWYNRFFTLHGAIMVFMVIIPGVPAALGNMVLPLMLGAKDVAFPKLNLSSFYFWLVGSLFLFSTLFFGGVDTGWTFYTPYSIAQGAPDSGFQGGSPLTTSVYLTLTGVFILGFSSILTGLNFIVTIHKMRPIEMSWFTMPLYLWAIYATAVIQVLATPVIAITTLLLIVENFFGIGLFDPRLGGDPVLFQHFFWFYSHPAVYIMILPAMGVISELIAVHSHKHIFGYRFIGYSSVAIALFGFLVWGHHMFTSGMSPVMNAVFSFLTFSVSIPSAIKVFNWLATLYRASISINTPMLWALGFIFNFTIGGLTGLFLGTLAVDVHLHDTYFVVAHFHYVMMGSALFAFFGGLFHWWPKSIGRMYRESAGQLAFWLVFVGFNLAFLPQFIMGSQGMPRRYYDYDVGFQFWHQLSTIGAYTMSVGFVVMAYALLDSLMTGRPAPRNPWGGNSLEWYCQSPPITQNFITTPSVADCYEYDDWAYDREQRGYVLKNVQKSR
ncbi:MAG: cbb3-type cytochrome c oxidase subunit I [Planctomycetota bacterium]